MAPATGCRPRWHMARFVPVPGHAAVAHLSARPLTPVLGTLPPQDMEVLRCADLDARLLINVLGNLQPADTLRSAEGRMRAIAAALPCRGVLLARRRAPARIPGGEPARRPSKSTALSGDPTRPAAPLRHDRDRGHHLRHDRPSRRRHCPPGSTSTGCASHPDRPQPRSEPSAPSAHPQPLPGGRQQRLPAGAAHHRGGHGLRAVAGAQDHDISWSGARLTGFCAPRRRRRCVAAPPACGPGARPQPARRRIAR